MRGHVAIFVVLGALAGACVRSETVPCGADADGAPMYCPAGASCRAVTATDGEPIHVCATDEQLGCTAGAACEAAGAPGTCHDGVCLPIACGNRLLDAGEGCDDGNAVDDDGCSITCQLRICGNAYVDPGEDCDDGNALSHDGCSSTCANEVLEWELVAAGPPRTGSAVAAFDPIRARTVLFDGISGDTFEWDGTVWTKARLLISGPSRRTGSAAAFDGTHMVVFGGASNAVVSSELSDHWRWDGYHWERLAQDTGTRPLPRRQHAMAYDSRRRRLVLFGGRATGFNGETWQWDGTQWVRDTAAPSPGARAQHAMAYDPSRGVIVMFGGMSSVTTFATTTWEYDGTWRDVTPPPGTSPPPRAGGSLAYDPVSRRVVLFGGGTLTQRLDDTWAWNGTSWTELPATPRPGARSSAALASSHAGLVLATGVQDGPVTGNDGVVLLDDTWTWNGTAWRLRSPSGAFAPSNAVHDTDRGRGVLVGVPFAMRELVDGRWATEHRTTPRAADGAALAYDGARKETVAFGGFAPGGNADATTWTWDGAAWTQRAAAAPSPPGRRDHAMTFDAARGDVMMFGGMGYGENAGEVFGDTWSWNGTAWTQAAASGPSPRSGAAMQLDRVREEVILFGGYDENSQYVGDTWRWKGGAWEALAVPGPVARAYAKTAWDPARRRIVLFGGQVNGNQRAFDAWEWDGAAWTAIDAAGAFPSLTTSMISLPNAGVLAFNLIDPAENPATELWRLHWRSPREDCRAAIDTDGDGLAGCADPDCWYLCAPTCAPGLPCAADAPRCGDGTCDAYFEDCRLCPGDCGACASLCGDFRCDATEDLASCPGDCGP